ncbi:carboxylating nicotinate-nucleotide diphosphorylase [Saccharibacillus alkalitolerans]|uniref:nicotinate-nucleotide diphosphorylase (carboxylating) n=1 Tax=Saccharibacillus alkalitolerans TaxID=2705290 RepID=A0ABX0F6C5_9BACL|nr:carboxylating nicotinate-nucleotide diphosphorylase [Saccharibacillus alkalitolerans]NGZ76501.1 carboxylating nicotinate-nucleotide diphosphorylase [Saccharibacillus alkalitolerans]
MQRIPLRKMLEHFYMEDIGSGDLSAQLISDSGPQQAVIHAKQHGIVAGVEVIREAFALLDADIDVSLLKKDGDPVVRGENIAVLTGNPSTLLTGERVALNLLQRMSGIATATRRAVEALNDPSIRICDTRKTTPGLRMLEKYAVTAGGGYNHRFGLYDGIMIKDNHIAAEGSITAAVAKARAYSGHMVKIEVEIEDEEQLQEAIAAGADIIMFDNCGPDTVRRFAQMTPPHIVTEASGGIDMRTLPAYAGTGVHYISLGFLTHSVTSLDISMDIVPGSERGPESER